MMGSDDYLIEVTDIPGALDKLTGPQAPQHSIVMTLFSRDKCDYDVNIREYSSSQEVSRYVRELKRHENLLLTGGCKWYYPEVFLEKYL